MHRQPDESLQSTAAAGRLQFVRARRAAARSSAARRRRLGRREGQRIRRAHGIRRGNKRFDNFADRLERELNDSDQLEARARRLAELLALALQGSLLVRHAPPEVADAGLRFASGGRRRSRLRDPSPQTQISLS